jgi:hypothetical protein
MQQSSMGAPALPQQQPRPTFTAATTMALSAPSVPFTSFDTGTPASAGVPIHWIAFPSSLSPIPHGFRAAPQARSIHHRSLGHPGVRHPQAHSSGWDSVLFPSLGTSSRNVDALSPDLAPAVRCHSDLLLHRQAGRGAPDLGALLQVVLSAVWAACA